MAFQIPDLPFSADALEPFISKRTIEFHYGKHHKKYYENLSKLAVATKYEKMTLEEVVDESHDNDIEIFNNAAQASNHDFFWKCLSPHKKGPSSELVDTLSKQFGSLENFKDQFAAVASKLFGSGWVWLVRNRDLTLAIVPMKDAGTPLTENQIPLLACDVWEHAYYLDYQNERPKFVTNFWEITNWAFVEKNLTVERTLMQKRARTTASQSSFQQ